MRRAGAPRRPSARRSAGTTVSSRSSETRCSRPARRSTDRCPRRRGTCPSRPCTRSSACTRRSAPRRRRRRASRVASSASRGTKQTSLWTPASRLPPGAPETAPACQRIEVQPRDTPASGPTRPSRSRSTRRSPSTRRDRGLDRRRARTGSSRCARVTTSAAPTTSRGGSSSSPASRCRRCSSGSTSSTAPRTPAQELVLRFEERDGIAKTRAADVERPRRRALPHPHVHLDATSPSRADLGRRRSAGGRGGAAPRRPSSSRVHVHEHEPLDAGRRGDPRRLARRGVRRVVGRVAPAQNASCRRKRAPAAKSTVSSSAAVSVQQASTPFTLSRASGRVAAAGRASRGANGPDLGVATSSSCTAAEAARRSSAARRAARAGGSTSSARAVCSSARPGGPDLDRRARAPAGRRVRATWSRWKCVSDDVRRATPVEQLGSVRAAARPMPASSREHVVAVAEERAGGLAAVGRQPAAGSEQADVQISTSGAGSASASPCSACPAARSAGRAPPVGARAVLDAGGHDEELARPELDVAVAELDRQRAPRATRKKSSVSGCECQTNSPRVFATWILCPLK